MAARGVSELKARLREIENQLFPSEPGEVCEPGTLEHRQLMQERRVILDELKRVLEVDALAEVIAEMEIRERAYRTEQARLDRKYGKGKRPSCEIMAHGGKVSLHGKHHAHRKFM